MSTAHYSVMTIEKTVHAMVRRDYVSLSFPLFCKNSITAMVEGRFLKSLRRDSPRACGEAVGEGGRSSGNNWFRLLGDGVGDALGDAAGDADGEALAEVAGEVAGRRRFPPEEAAVGRRTCDPAASSADTRGRWGS